MRDLDLPVIAAPGRRNVLLTVSAALLGMAPLMARAEETPGYTIEVADLTTKVGESTTWQATLRPRPGVRMMQGYRNRIMQLSSWDDGVEFHDKSFPGVEQDGVMKFEMMLHATKAGTHAINGVFRVGYLEGTEYFAMVSLPMIAKVIATA